MDIVSTAIGLAKSVMDFVGQIFGKKNAEDIKDREIQAEEQKIDDKADKILKDNNINEIRKNM